MKNSLERSSILALAGAVLAYCATPWFGFVFDDRKQVLASSSLLQLSSIPEYFLHKGGYLVNDLSYYRPLFGTWMNLNYSFFGLHPAGWHIALLLLHLATVVLCYRLVLAIVEEPMTATIAAFLFAVHPIHVESVAWISGGTDPLAAIFILLASLFYLDSRKNMAFALLSWLAFAASLLCKETALLFPVLILANEILRREQGRTILQALQRTTPYVAVGIAYLLLRIHLLGAFSHTNTPLSLKVLSLTLPSVAVFYLRVMFLPAGLSSFYDTPYVSSVSFSGLILPVLVLLAFLFLLALWIGSMGKSGDSFRHKKNGALFFLLWTVLFLLPAFNLSALDFGEIAHDRYLYIPSIGFCALAAMALRQLQEKVKLPAPVRLAVAAGLAVLLCSSCFAQSFFWKDDLSLYKRGAAVAPHNIFAQNNLANTYLEQGDFQRGIAMHKKILELDPQAANSYFNLGLAYYNLGNVAQAIPYLQQAIALRPAANSYYYLGLAQFKTGDSASAERSLQISLRLDPGQPRAHAVLGIIYETQYKLIPALQELEQSLRLDPLNQNIAAEVAKIKKQLGQ